MSRPSEPPRRCGILAVTGTMAFLDEARGSPRLGLLRALVLASLNAVQLGVTLGVVAVVGVGVALVMPKIGRPPSAGDRSLRGGPAGRGAMACAARRGRPCLPRTTSSWSRRSSRCSPSAEPASRPGRCPCPRSSRSCLSAGPPDSPPSRASTTRRECSRDRVRQRQAGAGRPGRDGACIRATPTRTSPDVLGGLGGRVEQVFQWSAAEEAGPDPGEHDRPEDEPEQGQPGLLGVGPGRQ